MSWYPVDHIIKRILEDENKAVWFDTQSRDVKRRGYAKRRKRLTVKQNEEAFQHILTEREREYLRQRVNKRKLWLPRRVRTCARIKRIFKVS